MANTATSSANSLAMGKSMKLIGLGAPFLIILLLAMMIVPLPPFVLDLLFTFNISLSLIILLVAIYIARPLDFGVFPSVLLVATLLRLALNIASTRVVLLQGHNGTHAAGQVIEAFGEFVVGGNYAVGLVVFAILVIINFVVVTKGAGRISEVTARFTLDAMPGKQMAIDADLNSGLIDQDVARVRRDEVASEASFYGAMDGASKFVRGDAIAGILILFISVVGGFAIGTLQHGLSASQAVTNYILLTIGDGLVAQIPSLLLSVAAALIVTRVGTSGDMGDDVRAQFFDNNKIFYIAATIIAAIGFVPGMPFLIFGVIAAALAFLGSSMAKEAQETETEEETGEDGQPLTEIPEEKDLGWDDVLGIDVIGLEVGYRLISLVDETQGGELLGRIKGVRKKISQDLGFLIPSVHIKDNLTLPPNAYRICIKEVPIAQSEVHPGMDMAINSGQVFGDLEGIASKDPAFDLDTVWINPSQKEEAQSKGYTVVDCSTVIGTHLSHVLRSFSHEFIGHDEVQKLLDSLSENSPKLVENLVPDVLSLSAILKVLQNLLQEGVPIRDTRSIIESLAEHGPNHNNFDELTAAVRSSIGRTICQSIVGPNHEMKVITLQPDIEQLLVDSLESEQSRGFSAIEPGLAETLLRDFQQASQEMEFSGQTPVALVSDRLRIWLARFLRASAPRLRVLAFNEVGTNKQIRVIATLGQGKLTAA